MAVEETGSRIKFEAVDGLSGVLGSMGGAVAEFQGVVGNLSTFLAGGFAAGGVAAAAAIIGIGAAVAHTGLGLAEMTEQLERQARASGTNIEDLQVMKEVIKEAGGNSENTATALAYLNRNISDQNPILARLGITTRDALTAEVELGKAFASSDDAASKNKIAMALLGRGGKDLIADVEALGTTFDSTKDAMERTHGLITKDMLPGLERLDAQGDLLSRNWGTFMLRMKEATVGPANYILEFLNKVLRNMELIEKVATGGKNPLVALAQMSGSDVAGPAGSSSGSASGIAAAADLAGALREHSKSLMDFVQNFIRNDLAAGNTDHPALRGTITGTKFGNFGGSEKVADTGLKIGDLQRILGDWHAMVRDITSSAGILGDTLSGVWNGLQSGFQQVFADMLSGAGTFKSAITGIFKSLVSEILAEIGRLVAAQVFKLLLNVVGIAIGGPAGALAGVVGGTAGVVGGDSARRGPIGAASLGAVGTTINVYAQDTRSFVQSMTSSGSGYRRALDVVRFQGA